MTTNKHNVTIQELTQAKLHSNGLYGRYALDNPQTVLEANITIIDEVGWVWVETKQQMIDLVNHLIENDHELITSYNEDNQHYRIEAFKIDLD